MSYTAIPEPPASSVPDHLIVKVGEGSIGGRAATLLVGAPASIVVRASLFGSVPWVGSSSFT